MPCESQPTEDLCDRLRGMIDPSEMRELAEAAANEIERLYGVAMELLRAFPSAQTRSQEDTWIEANRALRHYGEAQESYDE